MTITHHPDQSAGIDQLRSVDFAIQVPNAEGSLQVTLELETPGGLPFEKWERNATAPAGQPVQVDFTLPVAGTLITQGKLAGTWKATVRVDGKILQRKSFEIGR
jgi:hypothetical protein